MSAARADRQQPRSSSWWQRMWKPFWAIPVACALAAVALGVLLPLGDEALRAALPYVFEGGPGGARGLLGTIATGMISMTGLVFSITMVVLQLASSQFTPRVLGAFLDSRITQATLGVFTASFVFALTVTRSVRDGTDGGETFVPQVSVTVAFLLVLASVGCFLAFIHHITSSIQVSQVISRIGERTAELVRQVHPEPGEDDEPTGAPGWSPGPGTPRCAVPAPDRHGVITRVDRDALVAFAAEHDVVVTLERAVGDLVLEGQEVLHVWGVDELDEGEGDRLYRCLDLGSEREMVQDVAFGVRQLVDIAERALSPGINDPTTAVQCVDELHRVLRLLVQRTSPSPYVTDDEGRVRLVHRPQTVAGLVDLAVAEINHYGKDSLQVPARQRAMLDDLLAVALERHRPVLRRAREALDGPVEVS